MDKPQKICYEDEECCAIYRLSQKLRTNGPLRCRRDYRKNVKKIQLDLFSDLAVFESGPKQVNYFAIYRMEQKYQIPAVTPQLDNL
jgi:hypothetical protein